MFRRTGHLTISSKEPTLGGAKDREILFIVNQYKMEEGIFFAPKPQSVFVKLCTLFDAKNVVRSAKTISENRLVVKELGTKDDRTDSN